MRITLNGKSVDTSCKTAFMLRKKMGVAPDAIVIVNGFQISTDCLLKERDVMTVVEKGILPSEDELESMMAARHTPMVHQKVKKAKVAVAGLGGLGSHIAVMLARTGVGQLLLVDFDIVEPSNLNRQNYGIRHLGMHKTQALQQQINEINPFIKTDIKTVRVEESNVTELFSGYDIVCEAFDEPTAKAMLVNTLLTQLPTIKVVAASGMAGFTSSNLIRTERKMKNFYLCGDFENGAKEGNGLMAPRVQICAGHQANMVLRLLLGINEA